jgi:hypothetical protein
VSKIPIRGAIVSAALTAAVFAPVLRDPPRDSFPLSTYPMFTAPRERVWVHVVVGLDAQGGELRLGPAALATDEVMQASQTVARAVRRGKKARRALCAEVAARVPELAPRIVRVEVRSLQFDSVGYFTRPDEGPLQSKRRARCAVVRGDS